MVYRVLGHFRATPGVGDLLAAKLLGMILLAFLSILLLSNIITALSSFFLARDLELLAAAPVDGLRVYAARFIETLINSSWMMVLVLLPILARVRRVVRLARCSSLVTTIALAGFLVLPAVVGIASRSCWSTCSPHAARATCSCSSLCSAWPRSSYCSVCCGPNSSRGRKGSATWSTSSPCTAHAAIRLAAQRMGGAGDTRAARRSTPRRATTCFRCCCW
jgi:hypothetical protein